MKRPNLNFLIDGFAFAAVLCLVSTGLLLRYQLPPGSGGLSGFGLGHEADQRAIGLLWGWTRHEWGDFHYWSGAALIAILALHVVLHWKWIVCKVRGNSSEASGQRFGVGLVSLIALVAITAAPLVTPTKQSTRGELNQGQSGDTDIDSADSKQELHGSSSLADAAKAAGLTATELIEELELPRDVPPDEPIGPLLRRHGLRMSDLRRLVNKAESRPETSH